MLKSFSLVASLAIISAVNALPLNPFNYFQNPFVIGDSDREVNIDSWYYDLPVIETEALQALINKEGLEARAEKLYNISKSSTKLLGHPTRVIGSEGHWGTIHYITAELRKLGGYYKVETQTLTAIDGKVNSYSLLLDGLQPASVYPLSLTPATKDYRPVHGDLILVDNFGCSLEDFPSNTVGNIVLVKRGECAFGDKSINAGLSGALGAIIYDPNEDSPLHGTLGDDPTGNEVATVSISKSDAEPIIAKLAGGDQVETTLYVDAYVKNISTLNVIAETTFGDHDNVVSLGAHSDSVFEGPGINDDGSGTISLLEVAKYLSHFQVNNAVRFAWWAAEEEGLIGSTWYAESLSPAENQKLRFFLDYDMMASPNYEYEVYDANNVDHPNGSGDIKDLFIDWYTEHGYNYTLVPFDGRSDYVGFIDVGIPAGGIATGAEGIKDKKSQAKFGGKVGHQFDDCYHQLCDDLSNPDYEAWVVNTKLIAHSVAKFANSFEGFPVREAPSKEGTAGVESAKGKVSDGFKYRGSKLII
ncbi:aminopeptidase Y [[Candida] railenensis]|uniref:Peptide hydrolase n=1 Tax=[Candida] railenensis TaxID=45579 RepID=A0A9P0VVP0_9ASCO|nr:aminopeptidase Y [[Candida] railenensis]